MDPRCVDYLVTEAERLAFERDGFFVLEDVLPDDLIDRLIPVVDRVDAEYRKEDGIAPDARSNKLDFIGKDEIFLELLDWYKTFPKVWGLMNWNIQLYHSHMIVTPPAGAGKSLEKDGLGLGWHQDSGRLNQDFETDPRPMVSLKVAFFLTDASEPGRGNFTVVPGSQKMNSFPGEDRKSMPEGAIQACVPRGGAVVFDRRVWHSSSNNYWDEPRRTLFYGYSYRWLRPRDNMTVAHYMDQCDPIRQQLLGASPSGGHGYTSPKPEDVPLKAWIEEHLGEEAVVR